MKPRTFTESIVEDASRLDTLLRKLISGELRVNRFEAAMKTAP